MTEVEKKYYRVCFSVPPSYIFSNMEMKEHGYDEESDDIDFAHTYYVASEEQAIADCMLDYHLISKLDIFDIYITKKYQEPDFA